MHEERLIIRVIEMYYKQGMSQTEIGKKFDVSRSTISRILTEGKKKGYVQIQFNFPLDSKSELENQLEEKYGLKEALIASKGVNGDVSQAVASLASDYILRILKDNMIIAITRGTSLQKMVEVLSQDVRLRFLKTKGIQIVPIEASTNIPFSTDSKYTQAYSNYLIEELAKLLGAHSYQLLAPQYVTSLQAKENFLKEESIREVMDLANRADAAFMGIGTVDENSSQIKAELIPIKDYERLRKKGAQGEILSHVIDRDGHLIEDEFENHLISLSLRDLKKIPIRVGVACGPHKKDAILSVLHGKIINVLVTDEEVANYLLKEK